MSLLNPKLASLRANLYDTAYASDTPAGQLTAQWAKKTGLPVGIPVAVGALDAHLGAVGAGVGEGVLVKIIGTSTCDISILKKTIPKKVILSKSEGASDIPGICGSADGSVIPGCIGVEAGQSAVGDIFKWFVEKVLGGDDSLHAKLTKEAGEIKPGQSGLIALDWNNGNRTILVNPHLTGLILGQTLYTTSAEIYRALIESTAFGARVIIDRLTEYGVSIDSVVCVGGIPEKNPLLMQIYADVTGRTMQMAGAKETCSVGSAVAAAVTAGSDAGGYDSFPEAQKSMTSIKELKYKPNPKNSAIYNRLYEIYRELHDGFGGVSKGVDFSEIMKRLIEIKS